MILRLALLVAHFVVLPASEAKVSICSVPEIREKNGDAMKVVKVNAERDARLICTVKDSGVPAYWIKDNKTLHTADHPRMRIRTNNKHLSLKIKKLEEGDAGLYTCVAENNCGRNTYTMQLLVESPRLEPAAPRFTVPPYRLARYLLAFPVGYSMKLDCSADGYPRPTVTWYKDGAVFTHRRSGGRLYLNNQTLVISLKDLLPSDTGEYTCNVSNAHGWINHTYFVDVRERVHAEPVVIPMENVTVYEGENATLLCKALSDSAPHFQWLRWFENPSNGSTNSSIEHNSHYEVIKQNEHDLIIPPIKNTIDFHGVKLTLVNVTKKEQGKYTCIVGNAVGYAVEQAYIIVREWSDVLQKHVNSSVEEQDVIQKHGNISDGMPATKGRKGEEPGNKSSGTRFQYLELSIGMLVGAVVLMIVMFSLCYWKIKKIRAQSSAANTRRPAIDSLRAKHEVQNEYVVVPDFN